MKKKIVSIFVSMLLCVTVLSVTGTEIFDESGNPSCESYNPIESLDMWDVQFHYDVGGDTGSLYLVGAVFDGTYFYCPEFSGPSIYRIDHDGNYVDSFTISGVPQLLDLTYDGTYVYGAPQSPTVIYEMDFTTQTLVSTITPPSAAWNIAYDEEADGGNGGFWIGQWQTHLTLIDRSGNVLDSISPVPDSMLGLAWDPWTEISGYNGPFLWIFTGTTTGGQGVIKVIDLDTKTIVSGVEHNVALDLGMGIAGGLGFTTEWEEGFGTLYGMIQGAGPPDDYLFGYEICITNAPPETPSIPDGPDEGLTGVEYTFTSSTTDPEGEQVYYMFDWGDGTFSEWIGPYPSGTPGEGSHAWDNAGDFEIRAKAKDINGGESGWSDPHILTILGGPILDIDIITGGLFKVSTKIKNIGATEAENVQWNIELDGGFILFGRNTSGETATIPADGDAAISSGAIVGLGKTAVIVTAWIPDGPSDTRQQSASVLLFVIFVKPGG